MARNILCFAMMAVNLNGWETSIVFFVFGTICSEGLDSAR